MMTEFSNDPNPEQSRDLIGYAIVPVDRPVIQTKFIQSLHRCLNEIGLSEELIITDPFIFNAWQSCWGWYQPFLRRIFEPLYAKVKRITFVTSDKHDRTLFNQLETHANAHGCRLRIFTNNLYHDRFWLSAGNQRGVFVGNSLTGIGAKYCLVIALPDADAEAAYQSLEDLL
jgi:hypothetical protein